MSTVAADAGAAPAKGQGKGKKKLILFAALGVLVLAVLAVGALMLLKQRAAGADDEAADDAQAAAVQSHPRDAKEAPTYVPLEPFTVNLADREADRYAQIAVTLELADPAVAASVKAFMPAIRNHILMTLAHKTARELMERDGKERLAQDIRRDAARGMGMTLPDEVGATGSAGVAAGAAARPARAAAAVELPVSAVYFSTFIVQ